MLLSTATFAIESHTSNAANNIYTEDKLNISLDPQHKEFVIKLKSNPTTGYSWFLREYNPNFIVPIKHSFQHGNEKMMGAPGYEFWTFRVKPSAFMVPHQLTIRFVYARPWQGADNSTQIIFRVTTMSMPTVQNNPT